MTANASTPAATQTIAPTIPPEIPAPTTRPNRRLKIASVTTSATNSRNMVWKSIA